MKIKLILLSILALGLALRLYKIDIPLADHHSWRQADSAAVIRNLAFGGSDIFHPQWDNLMPTNAGNLPNPNRYFFEDCPLTFDIYPALLLKVFGNKVLYLRLPSVLFSLLTIVFLYLLVSDLTNKKVGLLASFFYAVLPYSIFFTRGVFQEVPLNFYTVGSLFFLNRYLQRQKNSFFALALVFNCLLFLTKPYALVFLLPELVLFWQKDKIACLKNKRLYLFFLISITPFVAWWLWVKNFPEGIPYSSWLLNEGNIRFKGAFFYWIFAQRLGNLILGFYGILFFGLGLFLFEKFQDKLFYFWLLALLVYVSIIAKGNVTHDYYQIPFLPVVAYFMAKGMSFLLDLPKKPSNKLPASPATAGTRYSDVTSEKFVSLPAGKAGLSHSVRCTSDFSASRNKKMAFVLILIFLSFCLAFSWYDVRDFYNLQSGVDLAGAFIDKNVPQNVLVIAGDGADSTLLFNTNRRGWAIGYGAIYENSKEVVEKLRNQGAAYYVTTKFDKNSDFGRYMIKNYPLIKETDQYVVFTLIERLN